MRSKTIFGALLVSVALCSQGFGFELLDRMLGLNCGGCGECKACAKVACCEKACPKACAKVVSCEKACPKACEPACGDTGCGECKKCRCTPVRDLFAGLKDMFEAKGCVTEEPKACRTGQAVPARKRLRCPEGLRKGLCCEVPDCLRSSDLREAVCSEDSQALSPPGARDA